MGVQYRRWRAAGRWRSASTRAACSRAPIRALDDGPTSSSTSRRFRPTWPGRRSTTFSGFTMSVCQLRPESRGHVALKSRRSARARRRCSPTTCRRRTIAHPGRRDAARAQARGDPRARALCRRRIPAGAEAASDDDLLEFAQNTRRDDLSPVRHLQDGAGRRCAGGRRRAPERARRRADCASSTAASCRRSYRATPTRRSS